MLTFKMEDVDVREEVEKVVVAFERFGGRITVSCPSVTVFADPLRLRQILRNLIANACAHGGSNIDVSAVRAGSVLTLWVADDGPGVPDHVKDRLFQRYVHQGDLPLLLGSVGLGLAIARVLAREMGGDIRYERVDGHTYFVLDLPVAAGKDRSPVGHRPVPPEVSEVGIG
jgi:signal transduction histidine kinase